MLKIIIRSICNVNLLPWLYFMQRRLKHTIRQTRGQRVELAQPSLVDFTNSSYS